MLLAACAKPTAAPTEAPATEAPTEAATPEPTAVPLGPVLKIGMISSVSGAMALYSLQQQRGFDLGLEYASGGVKDDQGRWVIANRPVEVILKDDELNAEKGVALARELIEKDGVEILQGPVSSAVAVALTTVALENKMILMIDPAASAFTTGASFNPYVFRTSRTSYHDTMVIAKYLVENVGKNFAHIYIDNAFGQGSEAALEFAVGLYGGPLPPPSQPLQTPLTTPLTSRKPWIQELIVSSSPGPVSATFNCSNSSPNLAHLRR